MDGQKFDDITRALATGTSRRTMIKGLAVGALGTAFGLRRASPVRADHQVVKACAGGSENRQLGESCSAKQCCVASENLVCERVAETGAHRCECDLHQGFVACGGQCVSINCPGGGQLNTATCECECPTGTVECNGNCVSTTCPTGQTFNTATCVCGCANACTVTGAVQAIDCTCSCPTGTVECNGACVNNTCPTGQTFNTTTCSCSCPACTIPGQVQASDCTCSCPTGTVECNGACVNNTCPTGQVFNTTTCACGCPEGQVFCGGACYDPATTCAGLHNKIFNIECCNQGANPCQNPGQPSGRCKA